jgi:PAS domain S-box-containing protein
MPITRTSSGFPEAESDTAHSHSILKVGRLSPDREALQSDSEALGSLDIPTSFHEIMFDKHPQGMWVYDADTYRFLSVNESAIEQYGYTRDEFLAMTLGEIQCDESDPRLDQLRDPDPANPICHRHRKKDGTEVFVEVTSREVQFGEARAMLALLSDITQRRQAEAMNQRLVTAIEQTAECIMISDPDGLLVYVNPAFERITGYTRAEVIGQSVRIFKSGQHDADFYRKMWEVVVGGQVWSGQIINKKKDGSLYCEEMTISPVCDPSGQILNYVAVKRDVTRELALEEQLRQSQKMEAIGQLAGGIAHDFNNLLTIVQGNAALMLEDPMLDSSSAELVRDIAGAVERATGLTRQLLVVSRKQAIQPVEVNVNEIVESLANMLRRVLGEATVLRCVYSPDLPLVYADRGMLQQVLLNLSLNARDSMPNGGQLEIATSVKIVDARQVKTSADPSPGSYVCLRVSDTGHGIAAENLSRIFDPFYTTKDVGQGTGLGLATVYSIIKQHHGWVETYSKVDLGSTFLVYFPTSSSLLREHKPDTRLSNLPCGTETILVAEDDFAVRQLVRKLLERCGYTVWIAESGVAALALWEMHKDEIHLLLTDIMMPGGILGSDLAKRLKAEKPQLKVIFTSGYGSDIVNKLPPLVGGVNMIHKPWQPKALAQTVRNCLDQK